MTREEAIKALEHADSYVGIHYINGVEEAYINPHLREAVKVALTALRPVSREQVEKVWTGCEKCRDQANWPSWIEKGFVYCPKCGAPLTSWAWEKQVERMEAMKDGKGD